MARDFRYAVRSLRKDLRFTFVAVFALTLGIAATTVVFSVFYNLLFSAVAAKDAQRLVVPIIQDAEHPDYSAQLFVSWPDLKYLKEHNHVFEGVVGRRYGRAMVHQGAKMFQFSNARVTPDAFEFYGVPALLGRGIVSEDGLPNATKVFVMSYSTWKGEFAADRGIVGTSFIVDGEQRTLIGVMPERFRGFGTYQEIFTPVDSAPSTEDAKNGSKFNVMARVRRGVTFAVASAEFDVLAKQLAAMRPSDDDYPKTFTGRVVGANDYLMGISQAGKVFNSKIELKSILWDLLAAVSVLLLIACSNVANLLLARATVREKEIAVRSALGASRAQILSQLLMESLVLALCALAAGCALAWMAMKAVDATLHQKGWAEKGAEAVIGLDVPVLLFAGAITLLTTLLCGLVPALRASKRDLQPQLVGSGQGALGGLQHGKLRAGLVIGQVALSIVLLIGAGLMMRSLYMLTHVDLGFDPKNLIVIGLAPSRSIDQLPDRALMASPEGRARFQRIVQKIRELPGVESVAVDNTIPAYGPYGGPEVTVPRGARTEKAGLDECDENCADTLRLRVITGRWLSKDEVVTRQYATVLNETLARDMFGDDNPIGKQLEVKDFDRWKNGLLRSFHMPPAPIAPNQTFQIVGVVADVKNAGPQQPAGPMAFIPPMITGDFILQVRTRVKPGLMLRALQDQVWAADRAEVFWIFDPLQDFLEQHTYATPEFGVTLSGPLAGIALLLVVIGVFSVMAYTVSLQTREIGVRMALGAQERQILQMVLKRGSVLMVVGTGIGLFASFGATRLLASQIWGISPTDPWTFGAVVTVVVVAGFTACYLPARRATRVNPLVALRYE
ncbi:MAG TPA: ABC transporter permease [Candidatus Polarisedimenticolia bacterium]|nr:ABC transporter permease [Candidatus Polarisedimenticolia bacterium]